MKLFVPEPNIDVYSDGFGNHDRLNRKDQGIRLSNLVENVSDPMVIALDGHWGSGKSVFLKCWVGEHTNDPELTAELVYFDAFKHDFMNDPLIALVSILDEQIKKDKNLLEKGWKKLKGTAPLLARVGLAATTAGVSEIAGAIGGAIVNSASEEIDKFWEAETAKQAAVQEFREALTMMTEAQKLVIVIDELDRCRPDFALSMLEIVKHLFSVPNVHFVLGVNLKSLENSVKARYGSDLDAAKYLQKFYNLSFSLRGQPNYNEREIATQSDIINYFNSFASGLPQDRTGIVDSTEVLLQKIRRRHVVTFRDLNFVYAKLSCLIAARVIQGHASRFAILTLLQILNKDLFDRFIVSVSHEICEEVVFWFGFSDASEKDTKLIRASEDLTDLSALIFENPQSVVPGHHHEYLSTSLSHGRSYTQRKENFEQYVLIPFLSIPMINA